MAIVEVVLVVVVEGVAVVIEVVVVPDVVKRV